MGDVHAGESGGRVSIELSPFAVVPSWSRASGGPSLRNSGESVSPRPGKAPDEVDVMAPGSYVGGAVSSAVDTGLEICTKRRREKKIYKCV